MNIIELLRGFVRTFARQRIRALLTLLGIVIATGSVVMLTGLLQSAREALMQLSQNVNESDTIRINRAAPPREQREKTTRPLSQRDGDALARLASLAGVEVTPEARLITRAHYKGKQKRVRVMGVDTRARTMYRLQVERGRFIDDDDLQRANRIAVIGHEVYTELLKKMPEPLGEQIRVDKEVWTIVGVLAHKPYSGHGTGTWMWDRRIVVPRTAFDASYSPDHRVQALFLKLAPGRSTASYIDSASKVAEALLLFRHFGVKNFKMDDRKGRQQEESILTIIQILLVATVLMSLFVGGINIMNIMLVTVTERTREIGIRRAVGASQRAIVAQFLFESSAMAAIGGFIGVVGGILANWLVGLLLASMFGSWNFHVQPWAIGMSMGLAVVTGIVFGLFPALRAARLDPVDALRS